ARARRASTRAGSGGGSRADYNLRTPMRSRIRAAPAALVAALLLPVRGAAQVLPSEPFVTAGGPLPISGNGSASFAPVDPGFYNYTDYDHSALRLFRLDVTAAFRAGDHFAVLGDIRTENLDAPRPYGLYVRIRPWTDKSFDIQAGRIPPTFGA